MHIWLILILLKRSVKIEKKCLFCNTARRAIYEICVYFVDLMDFRAGFIFSYSTTYLFCITNQNGYPIPTMNVKSSLMS